MLAKVMPIMMTMAPIMKPCDHDSSVICAILVGLDSVEASKGAILPKRCPGDKQNPCFGGWLGLF